jgi:very-short-patch-repair endonuclease
MDGHSALDQVLKRQHFVITQRQALACGVRRDAVLRRIRPGGKWQPILPGVYLAVTGTPTWEQQDMAALLYAGPGGTLTGAAALRRHGLRSSSGKIDVLVPVNRRRPSTQFVDLHRTARLPSLVCYVGPVQFALPARAVADAVRDLRELAKVRAIVANAVQTGTCTIEQLGAELHAGPMRGSALFRAALAEVAQGARSGPEAELLELIRRGRLPAPILNARLYVGTELLAQPDAWWPDRAVVVEVDSRQWHLSPEDWERTMRRHDRLTALGILVLHFTPRQIRSEPEHVLETIRAALACRRAFSPQVRILTLPAA